MDEQDWIPVTIKRPNSKKGIQKSIQSRDSHQNERNRVSKLEISEVPPPKKRIKSESLQELIRKRIEMKLTQEKADILCSFPRNTFNRIESNRLIPNEEQKRMIQKHIDIQLKIDTIV